MGKRLLMIGLLAILVLAMAAPALAKRNGEGGRGGGPVIYVYGEGQELFFDSIVVAEPVPNKGKFQKLEMGGPSSFGLQTEFGPGDQGYAGGRWWLDLNGNNMRDEEGVDHYFVCPLLGPGRDTE